MYCFIDIKVFPRSLRGRIQSTSFAIGNLIYTPTQYPCVAKLIRDNAHLATERDDVNMSNVIDKNGLVNPGGYLTVFNPVVTSERTPNSPMPTTRYNKALVFKVMARQNVQGEKYTRPLPTTTSTTFRSYDSTTPTASADGCLPGRAYTASAGVQFALSGTEDLQDMWKTDKDYYDRLFHVILNVSPGFVRVGVDMPSGTNQAKFQRTKKIVGIGYDFGWRYGNIETVAFPEIDVSYQFGNTTNAELRPTCTFTYGEYVVGIPSDPEIIFRVLSGREPSHQVDLPITTYDAAVSQGFVRTYGTDGFRVYPTNQSAAAVADYQRVISEECFARVLV